MRTWGIWRNSWCGQVELSSTVVPASNNMMVKHVHVVAPIIDGDGSAKTLQNSRHSNESHRRSSKPGSSAAERRDCPTMGTHVDTGKNGITIRGKSTKGRGQSTTHMFLWVVGFCVQLCEKNFKFF